MTLEKTDSAQLEDLELRLLLTAVAQRYGYDFRQYAPASLKRRVRQAVRTEGLRSISALQELLLHDPDSLSRFVGRLSVHVTGMFRDAEFFRALRKQVVPILRTYPFVRVWHAGCATGEEVYSLAIVLHEAGLLDRCRIYATDLSDEVVQRASRGIFPVSAMREYTTAYHRSGGKLDFSAYYTADSKHAILREDLRRPIVFSQHNLVSDRSFNEFQLIVCRNVMIYFDEELQKRVLRLLFDSLVRFGVLALGIRETLRFTPLAEAFEPLDERTRLYRRIG